MVAVDEHKVDVAALLRELRQQPRQQLVTVAGVEADPLELGELRRRGVEIERVDLCAVGGDPPQAAPLRAADLDRERRLGELEEPLERGALADRHLLRPVEQRREVGLTYHQTVESTPSSSSIGFVYRPEERYFQPSSGTRK